MRRRPSSDSRNTGTPNLLRRHTRLATGSYHHRQVSHSEANAISASLRGNRIYLATGLISSLIVRTTVRLRVIGAEHIPPKEAALLVANHVSRFDPVVLSVVLYRLGRQVRPVAVQELFDKPVIGDLAKALGWIPVRYGRSTDLLAQAQHALAHGDLVLIYPEGTIPRPGTMVPARRGAAVIALNARVSVIPIASIGLERHVRYRPWRRRDATVRIGRPIQHSILEKLVTDEGYGAASELLLERVRRLAGARSNSLGYQYPTGYSIEAIVRFTGMDLFCQRSVAPSSIGSAVKPG